LPCNTGVTQPHPPGGLVGAGVPRSPVGHDAGAPERRGRPRDPLWRSGIREDIDVAGFTDIPVLAKLAGQVASGRAERQDGRPG
jgi:hypothetical protein